MCAVMDVKWIDGVLRMIYPQVCEVCGRSLCRGEDVMCLHCLRQLPRVSPTATTSTCSMSVWLPLSR